MGTFVLFLADMIIFVFPQLFLDFPNHFQYLTTSAIFGYTWQVRQLLSHSAILYPALPLAVLPSVKKNFTKTFRYVSLYMVQYIVTFFSASKPFFWMDAVKQNWMYLPWEIHRPIWVLHPLALISLHSVHQNPIKIFIRQDMIPTMPV